MCIVSMIYDYARERIPTTTWTSSTWNDFQEIIRRLDALDKKLGQPDCHDPLKAAWVRDVEKRLRELEAAR